MTFFFYEVSEKVPSHSSLAQLGKGGKCHHCRCPCHFHKCVLLLSSAKLAGLGYCCIQKHARICGSRREHGSTALFGFCKQKVNETVQHSECNCRISLKTLLRDHYLNVKTLRLNLFATIAIKNGYPLGQSSDTEDWFCQSLQSANCAKSLKLLSLGARPLK